MSLTKWTPSTFGLVGFSESVVLSRQGKDLRPCQCRTPLPVRVALGALQLLPGMCFTCQRNLNEKRRTERKRATPRVDSGGTELATSPSLIYALGPHPKKFKLPDGNLLQLDNDVIIMNAPVQLLDGLPFLRQAAPRSLQDQGHDLQSMTRQAAADVDLLLLAVSGHVQDEAAAAVQAVGGAAAGSDEAEVGSAPLCDDTVANIMVHIEESECRDSVDTAVTGASPPIHDLYEKAFKSLNKAMYLLYQLKESWDGADDTLSDPNFADAVASAAAVAAAATDGSEQASSMVSLLLAADQRKNTCNGDPSHKETSAGPDFISL